jgi:glycosyltransferase involved in cell wall biosynthesis
MKLSVILPARNEDLLIKSTLLDIANYFHDKNNVDYEIIVVINGSEDSTEKVAIGMSKINQNIKILHSDKGYGLALRKGLKEAKGNYIAVFNVDFYDLKMLDLSIIDLYGKDMIIGSKLANWSTDKRPPIRRMISLLFNLYLRALFGFMGSDTHGIKIMKREVKEKVLPSCKTDTGIFDTEFVIRAQRMGFIIADYPVNIEEKRPPRFNQRIFQTLPDIVNLHKALAN